MTRHVMPLAALLMSVVAGAGCGRRMAPADAGYHDSHPLPAEPMVFQLKTIGRYGGRFVFGETSNPKTFNEMMANEQSSSDITLRLYCALTDFDNKTQEITPGLAKTWEVSPDGTTWTFHLRKGAAFSDGHPITSDDVLFNFQVAYDEVIHPSVQELLKLDGKP